ncbi:M-phase inducer phosphatase 1-B [Bienertia sinuspersici]
MALYLRLLGNKIMSKESNSNDINVDGLVFRFSVGAVEGYLGVEGANTHSIRKKGGCSPLTKKKGASTCLSKKKGTTPPVSEGLHKDKAQGCDCTEALSLKPPTHAPSTKKKFMFSFEGICKDLFPRSKLPEGLLLAQSIYCAKTALAFYNDKHGTDYKLVEPLSSARLYDYGVHFHCNFTAVKLRKDGSRAAQPKLFFANFIYLKSGLRDMYCRIVDPAKAIFWCCEVCPPDLAHCHRRAGMYNVLKLSSPEHFEAVRKRVYAEIALDVYNKKHGTEYELVKPLETNVVPVSFGTYRFHCNFKAQLEIPDNSDDGSIKLFFGDVLKSFSFSDGEFCILESTEGLDDHCSICRQGAVFHPGHRESPPITCGSM